MGRRLSDEERGARLVGKIVVRELGSKGKCALCSGEIQKGSKSLRYTDIVYGRKTERGLCMPCASGLWIHAEEAVGKVSAEIQKYLEENPQGANDEEDQEPELEADPQPKQVKKSPPSVSMVMLSGDEKEDIPDVALDDIEQLKSNREALLVELGIKKV